MNAAPWHTCPVVVPAFWLGLVVGVGVGSAVLIGHWLWQMGRGR